MHQQFRFDVFLSYSSKDREVVRRLAEKLRDDRLRVWFDEWEIHANDAVAERIEDGLERSRVLVLCMSVNAFGSDWAHLEAGTLRFRDPLNSERRFIPLRLDVAPIKDSLAQFQYIDWANADRHQEYLKLFDACSEASKPVLGQTEMLPDHLADRTIALDYPGADVSGYAFSSDGNHALSCGRDRTVRLWDIKTGHCMSTLEGHTDAVMAVNWSPDESRALSCSYDNTLRLWDVKVARCLRVFEGHTNHVYSVAWASDLRHALSCSRDKTVRLWDIETGRCLRVFEGHTDQVRHAAWSGDRRRALSSSWDKTLRIWDVETGRCLRVLEGHTDDIWTVAWSENQRQVLSGCDDRTIRVWDVESGICVGVLEGHENRVWHVAWNNELPYALSCSSDNTVRLWDVTSGQCLRILKGHQDSVRTVVWAADRVRAFSGDRSGGIRAWNLFQLTKPQKSEVLTSVSPPTPDQIHYTNAKVLLVGDSGAGKTGLSMRLALNDWKPSDSTVGAWATHWKLPISANDHIEREVWLWDFGGQADQRLIHQLYMEDTALAVLVFDGQKEDLFESLVQWERDLTRASRKQFAKILAAGRVDAGGLRSSRSEIEKFTRDHGFMCYVETSAKKNIGCEEIRKAIIHGIRWSEIPWRSSPLLFKRLKEEIIGLKDQGRVLMRFKELRDTLRLRMPGPDGQFKDEELKAVVSLLAGPGVVWELGFGSWVLLQPERINAYAQAVIQTLRLDEDERGSIAEDRVLDGDLSYHSSIPRLEPEEERFVLLAMHQTLVEHGLCLREQTDKGSQLVFPSYYRRERRELVQHPTVLVSYQFTGFLDEIYATLVVRLHHTKAFQRHQLWHYAADFKTTTGRQQGIKLTRRGDGAGELEVYFDATVALEEKIIFSRYVHEHLLQKCQNLVRLRQYVCPHCGTPVGNREVAMRRLEMWLEKEASEQAAGRFTRFLSQQVKTPTIICVECERRVPLWDELEQSFASPEMQERVRGLQERSATVLDNESKERTLVGEVISTVALAGQISREFSVSDHGIDMEVEFKDDHGEATGKKVYLQLKSGDSYLRQRRGDGAEVFTITKERHSRYWAVQMFPVILLIRSADGDVRWMEIRDALKRAEADGLQPVRQITFKGERFDVMSVRRWRDDVLT